MNYDQPRQIDANADRPDAGKWRWTTRNDNNVRPDGYCSPVEACPECDAHTVVWDDVSQNHQKCLACNGRGLRDRAEPCPGHDTAEEAAEHYRQYRIDRAEFVSVKDADANMLHRCKMCDKHTASYMRIPGEIHTEFVCDDHHDRAALNFLIGLTMGTIHS